MILHESLLYFNEHYRTKMSQKCPSLSPGQLKNGLICILLIGRLIANADIYLDGRNPPHSRVPFGYK